MAPARTARAVWTFADQVVSSGTNFLLTILVARSVSASAFGAFALGLSIYLVCLNFSRASVSDTVILGLGRARGFVQNEVAAGLSATLVLSCSVAIVVLMAAVIVPNGDMTSILLIMALSLPGLLLQDYKRIAFFVQGKPKRAFVSDCLWAVLQLAGIVGALLVGARAPAVFLAIWGASALVSGLLWPEITRGWLRQNGFAWLWRERHLLVPMGGEGLLFQLGNQASAFLLGALAGLSQVGGYRGAQSLFGPVTVLVLGIRSGVLPELMRIRRRSTKRALRAATLVSAAAVAFTALCGVALGLLPDSVGRQILGPTWATASTLIWLVAIDRTCNTLSWGSALQLRILFRPRFSFVVRMIATASSVVVAIIGARLGGAHAVAVGTAIMSPVLAAVWVFAVRRARRATTDTEENPVSTAPAARRSRAAGSAVPGEAVL